VQIVNLCGFLADFFPQGRHDGHGFRVFRCQSMRQAMFE
jgi:hypothetical protein